MKYVFLLPISCHVPGSLILLSLALDCLSLSWLLTLFAGPLASVLPQSVFEIQVMVMPAEVQKEGGGERRGRRQCHITI